MEGKVFVVTSFDGGVGKSTFVYRLSRFLKEKFLQDKGINNRVCVVELNLFRPSYFVYKIKNTDSRLLYKKVSFYEYFLTKFGKNRCERLEEIFPSFKDILIIPFIAVSNDESLMARYNINLLDYVEAYSEIIKYLLERDYVIIVDMQLAMTSFANYFLDIANAIYYLYTSEDISTNFAKEFIREIENDKLILSKLIFIKNFILEDSATELDKIFEREYFLPIESFAEINNDLNIAKSNNFDKITTRYSEVLDKILKEAFQIKYDSITSNESLKLKHNTAEIYDQIIVYKHKELYEYFLKAKAEIIASLEKKFSLSDDQLRMKVEQLVDTYLERNSIPANNGLNVKVELKKYLLDDILGLGPIEDFMRDEEIDEIMVNGPNKIFVDKRGKIYLTHRKFSSIEHLKTVIDRILMPVGRTINERTPYVDARLQDGSRVHAIIPPLSLEGPMLTIRKFSKVPFTMEDLIYRFKTINRNLAEFLKLCIRFRRNIVISGGASSGKTTLLNILANYIDKSERVITIEDSAELRISLPNLGRLEARSQTFESKSLVTIRDLVRNALRMRPDRIIVGECRGAEALDMLQAMNTGHEGSLTTLHANSTRDVISRLETMVLMAGVDLPLRAIREQIANAINIIIQTCRLADGSRKVVEVVEITGIEDHNIKLETIFRFEKRWISEDGVVYGEIVPTGYIPKFLRDMPQSVIDQYKYLFENS